MPTIVVPFKSVKPSFKSVKPSERLLDHSVIKFKGLIGLFISHSNVLKRSLSIKGANIRVSSSSIFVY